MLLGRAALTLAADVGDAELRRRLFEARRKAVQGSWKAAEGAGQAGEEDEERKPGPDGGGGALS